MESITDEFRRAGIPLVLEPGDRGYAQAVAGFDLSVDFAPAVIVVAQSAADVASAVAVAAERGTPLSILGGGHGRLVALNGGVAITLGALDSVEVDAVARTARIGAGCAWSAVVAVAAAAGLAAPCGSSPGVAVVGYLLGGGVGPLARSIGFSSDHVRSIDLVTAAEGAITVSRDSHPDLFWALRGGKVGFGVVTAVTVELLPFAQIVGGGLYFAAADAPAILRAYAEWAPSLPETTTASIALLRLPSAPGLPAQISGQRVAHVRFASLESLTLARQLLDVLLAIATPLLDTVAVLPYERVGEIHGDPAAPMPVANGTASLTALDAAMIDALLGTAGLDVEVPLSAVEIRTLGAATRSSSSADAVGGRSTAHLLNVYAAPDPSLSDEARLDAVRRALASTAGWQSDTTLVNFVGRANGPAAFDRSWSDEQRERLTSIRLAHDPQGVFSPH